MELDEIYEMIFETLKEDDHGIGEIWWRVPEEKRSPETRERVRLALLELVEKGIVETLRSTDTGMKKTSFALSRFDAQFAVVHDPDKVKALAKDFYGFGFKEIELKSGRRVAMEARLLPAGAPGHK